MTSPAALFLADMKTLWEALTPPDETSTSYAQLVTGHDIGDPPGALATPGSSTGHRTFWWSLALTCDPQYEAGAASTLCRWGLTALLMLRGEARTNKTQIRSIANETALLRRAVDKKASWSSGVREVVLGKVVSAENGLDAVVHFPFQVLTEETD